MSKNVVCCVPGDTVQRAAQVMKSEDVGSVPVVESQQNKRLVGIVTDRDLALEIVAEGRDAKSTRIQQVMTTSVVSCRAEDDIQEAIDAMSDEQVRRIPVVDNQERVIGIVAQADLARRHPQQAGQVVSEVSKPKVSGGGA